MPPFSNPTFSQYCSHTAAALLRMGRDGYSPSDVWHSLQELWAVCRGSAEHLTETVTQQHCHCSCCKPQSFCLKGKRLEWFCVGEKKKGSVFSVIAAVLLLHLWSAAGSSKRPNTLLQPVHRNEQWTSWMSWDHLVNSIIKQSSLALSFPTWRRRAAQYRAVR